MNAVNSQWSRAVTIIIAMVMGVVVWWPSVVVAQTMNFAGGPENTQWMLSGNVFELSLIHI